ncbi:MAG: nucleoid-associated protein [Pyrinomonadaceae bacterium]
MIKEYTVERVALHLVTAKDFKLAAKEVMPEDYGDTDDAQVIKRFFAGHLDHVWNASEAARTCSAKFTGGSAIRGFYDGLCLKDSDFFQHSCQMARLLHEKARGTRATPGLLLLLWVRVTGEPKKYLVMFKMDPGRADKIALRESNGTALLNLAVQHIEQALPDPGDQVLKWAITPHPNRQAFHLKVRDQEGKTEPARYFMDFLGCERRMSEKKQISTILSMLPEYVEKHHAGLDVKAALPRVMMELEAEPLITPEVVISKIKKSGALPNFSEKKFLARLAESDLGDLYVSSTALQATKIEYKLPSGISIKGPRAEMESIVEVTSHPGGETEFRIRTRGYEKKYVD